MALLFDPWRLRGAAFRNRIGVSPMCQYCCGEDGRPTLWHLQHLLSRALAGPGMVMTEAAAVTPEGRITPNDLGLWEDSQLAGHARLAAALAAAGAVPAIQLAHAGRKASRRAPWEAGAAEPGWTPAGPSALGFGDYATPRAMSAEDIAATTAAFVAAARRAASAGDGLIELHAAHGYLFHSFLSPLSNRRNDAWGGALEGRARFLLDTAAAVRAAIPDTIALGVRISHTDWVPGGWDTAESVQLARWLKDAGVDVVDVSSGGLDPAQRIPAGPGFQLPGAAAVREGAGVAVMGVGLVTEPAQAEAALAAGQCDMMLLARAFLRDPYWVLGAALALGEAARLPVPPQYERGWPREPGMRLNAGIGLPIPPL